MSSAQRVECLLPVQQILFESPLWTRGFEREVKCDSRYDHNAVSMMQQKLARMLRNKEEAKTY